ncbi:hypothetical protein [Achromobacter spanius]|uniref:hypothetical protein n=1 Tax=Achromobacter spanius TaxID=217203 RepID=UPI0038182520
MTAAPVVTFAEQIRAPGDYLYLLVDPLAGCGTAHPLAIDSLVRDLGTDAITRVDRPDLAHAPAICPALVQLAAPGAAAPQRLLELSSLQAQEDLAFGKRYVCGWLASPAPLGATAQHIAAQCRITSSSVHKATTPWFEPVRLELLVGALGPQAGAMLAPVSAWLLPTSWGSFSVLRSTTATAGEDQTDLVRHTQHAAQLVSEFLGIWRLAQGQTLSFAPWRWNGSSPLPPQAGVHAFRLIRDAQQLGLRNERDIFALSLYRVCVHPLLPKHPDIQRDIVGAANGKHALQDRFQAYDDAAWKRIFASLPRTENYS